MINSSETDPSAKLAECKSCAGRIYMKVGLYTVCAGPCSNTFHISCVGVSKQQLDAISRGIIWLCDICLSSFHDWKKTALQKPTVPDASVMHHDITQLKLLVSEIMNALEHLSPNNSASNSASSILRHSTPVASPNLMNRHQPNSSSVLDRTHGRTNEAIGTTGTEQRFQLVLSNIGSSVSEEDVKAMVCRCLGAPASDCDSVVKLVPKHVDLSLLDYICFKIVLKWRWKTLAMKSSTWPVGIKVREFFSRRNVWQPNVTN